MTRCSRYLRSTCCIPGIVQRAKDKEVIRMAVWTTVGHIAVMLCEKMKQVLGRGSSGHQEPRLDAYPDLKSHMFL